MYDELIKALAWALHVIEFNSIGINFSDEQAAKAILKRAISEQKDQEAWKNLASFVQMNRVTKHSNAVFGGCSI